MTNIENLKSDALWLNWVLFEMAVRLGRVERTGINATDEEILAGVDADGHSEGKGAVDVDYGELVDEFFERWDSEVGK